MKLAPDIAEALATATDAIRDERELHSAMLDSLYAHVTAAAELHARGDVAGSHERCKLALDLAHDALGDCDAWSRQQPRHDFSWVALDPDDVDVVLLPILGEEHHGLTDAKGYLVYGLPSRLGRSRRDGGRAPCCRRTRRSARWVARQRSPESSRLP